MDAEMKARELLALADALDQLAKTSESTEDADTGVDCTFLNIEVHDFDTLMLKAATALRALEQPEEESRAITALKVTLFGVECWLPSDIAKAVQVACEASQQGSDLEYKAVERIDHGDGIFTDRFELRPVASQQGEQPTGDIVERMARALATVDDTGSEWDDMHAGAQLNYRRMARAAFAAAGPSVEQPASAGEGFVCVPREPTPEMIAAGRDELGAYVEDTDEDYQRIYRRFINAAPTPPAAAQEDGRDGARYVFLRDNWPNVCTATGIAANGKFGVTEIFLGTINYPEFDTSTLDAAIDAAMLTSPDSGKEGDRG
jgi:hypothetical protein